MDKTVEPMAEFTHHEGHVEDVAWHYFTPYLFASTGADGVVCLWDA